MRSSEWQFAWLSGAARTYVAAYKYISPYCILCSNQVPMDQGNLQYQQEEDNLTSKYWKAWLLMPSFTQGVYYVRVFLLINVVSPPHERFIFKDNKSWMKTININHLRGLGIKSWQLFFSYIFFIYHFHILFIHPRAPSTSICNIWRFFMIYQSSEKKNCHDLIPTLVDATFIRPSVSIKFCSILNRSYIQVYTRSLWRVW